MTLAQLVKAEWPKVGAVPTCARRVDPTVDTDTDGPYTFYHFRDGSILGTRGRGKHHQIWAQGATT